VEFRHTIEAPAWPASVRALSATPRLSRRAGLWAVAFSFLVVAAFSTGPSSLYGLFEHWEHLSRSMSAGAANVWETKRKEWVTSHGRGIFGTSKRTGPCR